MYVCKHLSLFSVCGRQRHLFYLSFVPHLCAHFSPPLCIFTSVYIVWCLALFVFFVLPERIWHLNVWVFRRAGASEPIP